MWSEQLRQIYRKLIAIDVKLDMIAQAQEPKEKVADVRQKAVGVIDPTKSIEIRSAQIIQRAG